MMGLLDPEDQRRMEARQEVRLKEAEAADQKKHGYQRHVR